MSGAALLFLSLRRGLVFRASRPGVPVCLFPLCLRLHGCPRSQTIHLSVYWKKFSYNTDVIA